jgi:hypothetical protein
MYGPHIFLLVDGLKDDVGMVVISLRSLKVEEVVGALIGEEGTRILVMAELTLDDGPLVGEGGVGGAGFLLRVQPETETPHVDILHGA